MLHTPPGGLHAVVCTCGGGGQSDAVQQLVLRLMHAGIRPQSDVGLGHEQAPPGCGQVSPDTVQSVFVQHVPCGMHALPQTLPLLGQLHVPPGPEQTSPLTVQSAFVQHEELGMQDPGGLAVQAFCPAGH